MSVRVLIVEDQILIALSLEAVVKELGHHPNGIAADPATAKELAAERPDVAFVDIVLGKDPTGLAVAECLHRTWGISVIFLTASPQYLHRTADGALGVIIKPFRTPDIEAALDYVRCKRDGLDAVLPTAVLKIPLGRNS
jgi:DNA-binding LytR/AlgR family response regulator